MARTPWLGCGWETGHIDEDGGVSTNSGGTAPAVATATPAPRSGTYSLKVASATVNNNYSMRTISLTSAVSELYGRIPLYVAPGSGTNTEVGFCQLTDSTGANQLYLTINFSTGVIRAYTGGMFSGTLVGTASSAATLSAWNSLEFYIKVANSPDGIFQLWLNEDLVIDFSGGDTLVTANANVKSVQLESRNPGSNSPQGTHYIAFDDIAFNDTTGGVQDGRCGDAAVLYLPCNANGASEGQATAWDGSDGNATDNHDLCDEIPPATADYVTSADLDDLDSYGLADVPAPYTAAVLVQAIAYAALAAAGTGDIRMVVRSNSVYYPDAADRPLTSTYAFVHGDLYYVDPNGGGAWTTTKVNALESGVKVT